MYEKVDVEALERQFNAAMEEADTTTMRSVFAVFVEQMQNMIRYSAEKIGPEPDEALGMDTVHHGEEAYPTGEGAILVSPEDGQELPAPVAQP